MYLYVMYRFVQGQSSLSDGSNFIHSKDISFFIMLYMDQESKGLASHQVTYISTADCDGTYG